MKWLTKREAQRRAATSIIRIIVGASSIAACTWALFSCQDLRPGTAIVLIGSAAYGAFCLIAALRRLFRLMVIAGDIVTLQVMANTGDPKAIRALDGAPPDWIDRQIYPRYFEER